jgi:hypothetical protein
METPIVVSNVSISVRNLVQLGGTKVLTVSISVGVASEGQP